MRPLRARQCEHALGDVDADHVGRTAGAEMVRELARTAAQVQHTPAGDVGEQAQQVAELGGALPAGAEPLERRVAGEECGIVVDVLRVVVRHWGSSAESMWRSYRPRRPRSGAAPGAMCRARSHARRAGHASREIAEISPRWRGTDNAERMVGGHVMVMDSQAKRPDRNCAVRDLPARPPDDATVEATAPCAHMTEAA